jgi:hypothetical protein
MVKPVNVTALARRMPTVSLHPFHQIYTMSFTLLYSTLCVFFLIDD